MKGATDGLGKARLIRQRFNPRAREGRDTEIQKRFVIGLVSIHAPVKGATRWADL